MHLAGPVWKRHLKHSALPVRIRSDAVECTNCDDYQTVQQLKMKLAVFKKRVNQYGDVLVHIYQGLSSGVQLVFGSSQEQGLRQDVQSLSASLGAIIHLSFPEFVLVKRRTTQKPERKGELTQSHSILQYLKRCHILNLFY